MNPKTVPPSDCRTMGQVREGIDGVDRAIVALLGDRFRYMDAAARIKGVRESVRDETRKAQVLANVRRLALDQQIPADDVAALYELLIEASIAYELDRFDALRSEVAP